MIIRRPSLLFFRQWPRALSITTKQGPGSWPGSEPGSNSKLSPHEQLIQSLRSSLQASDPNAFNSNPTSSEKRPARSRPLNKQFNTLTCNSLFGGFYNGSLSDDPEDRSVLEQLRKLEAQYKNWGQTDKAIQIGKEIVQVEASSRQRRALRFGSGRPPSSTFSKPPSGPLGSDIRVESTGCLTIRDTF
ncbi:hypothetical protein BVRB_023270 [Beta vulgaris subsp. vulgaris]|uniref:Uncharacterized protein n=1 Tax=Beta vulgaris subsp. vulgaris TaxID=3555 RepID=A0A0J8B314_BETVV|nr:hypothetical protein BVRB_023270 [Beta vulgaris subsp. vulgaris]